MAWRQWTDDRAVQAIVYVLFLVGAGAEGSYLLAWTVVFCLAIDLAIAILDHQRKRLDAELERLESAARRLSDESDNGTSQARLAQIAKLGAAIAAAFSHAIQQRPGKH